MLHKYQVERILDLVPKDKKNKDCLYTDKYGNHCIAGEIMGMLGYNVPAYGSEENRHNVMESYLDDYFAGWDHDARQLLMDLQEYADATSTSTGERTWTWGEVNEMAIGSEY